MSVNIDKYETRIGSGSHWSLVIRRGIQMQLTDLSGGMNVGMLFYNPVQLTEKYNAPDTLKCQHTFKLTTGNCLYSDMGRIFASITADSFGWHETIAGNSRLEHIEEKWGKRDYQSHRNGWLQNGHDSFVTELAKYDLTIKDLAANINIFSEVSVDSEGQLNLSRTSKKGDQITLRFEMDTLVVLHTCPHPLNNKSKYPKGEVGIQLSPAEAVAKDDRAINLCDENRRGYQNNALYHLGL